VKNYKIHHLVESTASQEHCYCCGVETDNLVLWLGSMSVALCPLCENATWQRIGGYWQIVCPFHGYPDIKSFIDYCNAIDLFNEKFGTKKRGKRVGYGVNWKKEIENLRQEWRKLGV
jgi:hypothetical protein